MFDRQSANAFWSQHIGSLSSIVTLSDVFDVHGEWSGRLVAADGTGAAAARGGAAGARYLTRSTRCFVSRTCVAAAGQGRGGEGGPVECVSSVMGWRGGATGPNDRAGTWRRCDDNGVQSV